MQCHYNSTKCEGKLWQCETCESWFCQTHWNKTTKGTCVECQVCERERLKALEESLKPVANLIIHIGNGYIKLLLSDNPLDVYILDEDNKGLCDQTKMHNIDLYGHSTQKYRITKEFGFNEKDIAWTENVIKQIKESKIN